MLNKYTELDWKEKLCTEELKKKKFWDTILPKQYHKPLIFFYLIYQYCLILDQVLVLYREKQVIFIYSKQVFILEKSVTKVIIYILN